MPFKTVEQKAEYDKLRRERDRAAYAALDADGKAKVMVDRKRYYEANKVMIKARTARWTKKRMARNRQIIEASKDKPCMDCGRRFPLCVMDFDHREGETKWASLSSLRNHWMVTVANILTEIAKCDVVCANCHRIRTNERLMRKVAARKAAHEQSRKESADMGNKVARRAEETLHI
jgi:hypothetical protein